MTGWDIPGYTPGSGWYRVKALLNECSTDGVYSGQPCSVREILMLLM